MKSIQYAHKPATFPLFESVAAGFPSPAADYEDKKISLDEYCIHNTAATYFMRVQGDSMRGLGIYDSDLVVVDRSLKAKTGDVVVAVLNDEFTIKTLWIQGRNITLAPANTDFPPIHVEENTRFEIWGVVTNVIHRLR